MSVVDADIPWLQLIPRWVVESGSEAWWDWLAVRYASECVLSTFLEYQQDALLTAVLDGEWRSISGELLMKGCSRTRALRDLAESLPDFTSQALHIEVTSQVSYEEETELLQFRASSADGGPLRPEHFFRSNTDRILFAANVHFHLIACREIVYPTSSRAYFSEAGDGKICTSHPIPPELPIPSSRIKVERARLDTGLLQDRYLLLASDLEDLYGHGPFGPVSRLESESI